MRLLYATGNPAKIAAMQNSLKSLGVELYGLADLLDTEFPEIVESGNSPLENARIKAEAYYQLLKVPLFSCDSGLYFEQVPDKVQPGIHVRNVNGKRLTDEEMISYYGGLARQYGMLKARYRNAICLILDKDRRAECMDDSLSGQYFYITDIPHPKRVPGFPLDSLSIHIASGMYYYDLEENKEYELAVYHGFYKFFAENLQGRIKG